ncbi:nuclease-related domain-containing protein [Fredinandcohnia quinoae]|uniref:NERD domain-containing protein n=1 Tax=Fredinandcohnia quinoae TaxID=2918902 RepID=A0AAW5E024_9BACI|nr:nuclease-related domain-containing protein [Fredinandcohnia sp. SECRCQ15]MCH1624034.1 NERD domain-containing protein [Fredinandcohnia sp. SECRCQ15]
MIYKPRHEPQELIILRYLQPRMKFTEKEQKYFSQLEKGYQGEILFDARLNDVRNDFLVLNDLLFEIGNSFFQIDSLLITQNKIYLIDVKNYDGDFFIQKGKWYTFSDIEIKDPLIQLTRSESLLRRLFHENGFNLPIEASLIFINSDFYLYQAPLNLPITFPTQLNRFFKKLNSIPSKITDRHWKLAEKLKALHLMNNPFTRIPEYTYESLEKGITCVACYSFYTDIRNSSFKCSGCGFVENVELAVLRSIKEFVHLFPNRKIRLNTIHEWYDEKIS